MKPTYDAVVVGAGPNGLAAAITIAREGRSVLVVEAEETIGGGCRSAELTLPGFVHDVCSAIVPLTAASPFFRSIQGPGFQLVHPEAPLAHPLDDGTAVMLERSIEATAEGLGADDGAYRKLMQPLARSAGELLDDVLGPLRIPRHPLTLARFGRLAIQSAETFARNRFAGDRARALLAGIAAHAMIPLEARPTAGVALVLALTAHVVGWPMARGGSQTIADALGSRLRSLGGEIITGRRVESIDELPSARDVLLDVTPRQLLRIGGERLPSRYQRSLEGYTYGPGVFKVDWALDGPIPWKAEEAARAGTVHLGGTLDEIGVSERTVAGGGHPDRPYVLLAQQTPFDPTRAPEGKHTAWAYCHVPNGSTVDMTERIEDQVERFAPGFRDLVIGRSVMNTRDFERHDENYIGGDINGGLMSLRQTFARPAFVRNPYATPVEGLYLCSSSTPPGAGVHGMCGHLAARAALGRLRERS